MSFQLMLDSLYFLKKDAVSFHLIIELRLYADCNTETNMDVIGSNPLMEQMNKESI